MSDGPEHPGPTYTVASRRLPWPPGETVTAAQLADRGANIDALLTGGHLTADRPTPKRKNANG